MVIALLYVLIIIDYDSYYLLLITLEIIVQLFLLVSTWTLDPM